MRILNKKGIGSEWQIQEKIRKILHENGWDTFKMHGNAYQKGLPDTFCCHKIFGSIWIEFKKPGEKISAVQHQTFARMHSKGVKIYVLDSDTNLERIVTSPPNWMSYIRI